MSNVYSSCPSHLNLRQDFVSVCHLSASGDQKYVWKENSYGSGCSTMGASIIEYCRTFTCIISQPYDLMKDILHPHGCKCNFAFLRSGSMHCIVTQSCAPRVLAHV